MTDGACWSRSRIDRAGTGRGGSSRAPARPRRCVLRRGSVRRRRAGSSRVRDCSPAGEEAEVVIARRGAGGRPVIRLDRPVARGTMLEVPREALPAPEEGEYYTFQLVGLEVVEEGGQVARPRRGGPPRPRERQPRPRRRRAAAAGRGVYPGRRPRGGAYPCRARLLGPRLTSFASRRLHSRSACLRMAHRAAPGRDRPRRRARPEALLVPRHDAARIGRQRRRRAVRRRCGDGAARRRRRGCARRRLRRQAGPPRRRPEPAGRAS